MINDKNLEFVDFLIDFKQSPIPGNLEYLLKQHNCKNFGNNISSFK